MWVKICGNTRPEDAAEAARLGAHAVGLIFARSPRRVTPDQARAIISSLPAAVERVGVFDSRSSAEILTTAQQAQLTAVQLHGGFDLELLASLARSAPELELIQVLHWKVDSSPAQTAAMQAETRAQLRAVAHLARETRAVRVLIDSKVGAATGGTGVPFAWAEAAELFAEARQLGVDAIIAGGLRPSNVAVAIARLAPWGVDVSSGVEASPGSKDPVAMAAFLAKAHGAQST